MHSTSVIKKNPGNELLAFRYNAYLRDVIFQLALQICGNFSVIRDIAEMYLNVHRVCIEPGLKLVSDCDVPASKDVKDMSPSEVTAYYALLQAKEKKMKDYNDKAEKDVETIVKAVSCTPSMFPKFCIDHFNQKQTEIINSLQKRIDKIGSEIQEFPVEMRPSPKQIEAIKDSKQITGAALQEQQFKQPSALAITTGRDQTLTNTVDEVYKTGSVVSQVFLS